MAFEATAYPTCCAGFYTNPSVKALEHFEDPGNTEMAGGICVICMHNLRSGQQRHIDVNRVLKMRPARMAGDGGIEYQ